MSNDSGRTPGTRTDIGVSIGLVITIVVGFGVFLYSEIQRVQETTSQKCERFNERLAQKADKGATADRFTATQHRQHAKEIDNRFDSTIKHFEQRFEDNDRLNTQQHEAIKRELDHYAEDVKTHRHVHSEIVHDKDTH